MRRRSKRMAFNAWKKSGDAVTQAMVELMHQPFTKLRLDSAQSMALEAFLLPFMAVMEKVSMNYFRKFFVSAIKIQN
jgi:hypothetical protein